MECVSEPGKPEDRNFSLDRMVPFLKGDISDISSFSGWYIYIYMVLKRYIIYHSVCFSNVFFCIFWLCINLILQGQIVFSTKCGYHLPQKKMVQREFLCFAWP